MIDGNPDVGSHPDREGKSEGNDAGGPRKLYKRHGWLLLLQRRTTATAYA